MYIYIGEEVVRYIYMDWRGLSGFKSISSQNPS
jgi:hypothetical protein